MKPQFKLEQIYIDLSKLSEEQQRKVISLLPEPEAYNQYEILKLRHFILWLDEANKWWVYGNEIKNKTELTYSQFLDMMGGETSSEIETFTLEDLISFGKQCFYSGFEKSEKDDANCFTAWREEASGLLTEFKSKQ